MTKKTNTESQKSKFYDASEILKHEQDGTKYVLQFTDNHNHRVLAEEFDERAEDLREQFYESGLIDEYRSRMRELNEERVEQMNKVMAFITGNLEYMENLGSNDRREFLEVLDEIIYLLVEHKALIYQSFYSPWKNY